MKKHMFVVFLLSSALAFCHAATPPEITAAQCQALKKACAAQTVKRPTPRPHVAKKAARPPMAAQPTPPPPVQPAPPVAQQTPTVNLSVALATFVEIKSTDQQLLLLEEQNETAEIALKTRRLEEVEVPQQGTNQYRAQTEREIADQQEADDTLLTTAKVKLMGAEGTSMKVYAWGSFIGNVASPLTAWLGRTQISTTTNMDQGSVNGGNLSNSTSTIGPTVTTSVSNSAQGGSGGSNSNSNSNSAMGGAGGQGGKGGSSSASAAGGQGGSVSGSGNSSNSNSNLSLSQGGAGGSVSDSGNSSVHNTANGGSSSSSAAGGSSTATGGDQSQSQTTPPSS